MLLEAFKTDTPVAKIIAIISKGILQKKLLAEIAETRGLKLQEYRSNDRLAPEATVVVDIEKVPLSEALRLAELVWNEHWERTKLIFLFPNRSETIKFFTLAEKEGILQGSHIDDVLRKLNAELPLYPTISGRGVKVFSFQDLFFSFRRKLERAPELYTLIKALENGKKLEEVKHGLPLYIFGYFLPKYDKATKKFIEPLDGKKLLYFIHNYEKVRDDVEYLEWLYRELSGAEVSTEEVNPREVMNAYFDALAIVRPEVEAIGKKINLRKFFEDNRLPNVSAPLIYHNRLKEYAVLTTATSKIYKKFDKLFWTRKGDLEKAVGKHKLNILIFGREEEAKHAYPLLVSRSIPAMMLETESLSAKTLALVKINKNKIENELEARLLLGISLFEFEFRYSKDDLRKLLLPAY